MVSNGVYFNSFDSNYMGFIDILEIMFNFVFNLIIFIVFRM